MQEARRPFRDHDRYAGHSANPTIEENVSWAEGIAADQSHGYSQARRNTEHDGDCSSLVWFAIKHAGFPVGDGWPFTTFTMGPILQSMGFTHFSWSGNMADAAKSLQRGDIVVNPAAHTEMYRAVAVSWVPGMRSRAASRMAGRATRGPGPTRRLVWVPPPQV